MTFYSNFDKPWSSSTRSRNERELLFHLTRSAQSETLAQNMSPPTPSRSQSTDTDRLMQYLRLMDTNAPSSRNHRRRATSVDADIQQLFLRHQRQILHVAGQIAHMSSDGNSEPRTIPTCPLALSKLPKYRVLPRDRSNPAAQHQECGICCDPLVQGVLLTRLPCGHIHHANCVVSWLSKNNTCPECRYELETGNPTYEKGRIERMKGRPVVHCDCDPSGWHRCFFPHSLDEGSVCCPVSPNTVHCTSNSNITDKPRSTMDLLGDALQVSALFDDDDDDTAMPVLPEQEEGWSIMQQWF